MRIVGFMLVAMLAGCAADPEVGSVRVAEPVEERARSIAEFRPSVHGFAFVNSFEGSSMPLDLGVDRGLGLPTRYGLCGGMSAAAADYFLARREVPGDVEPPARGSALWNYLYMRQAASLGVWGAMSLKFAEWMRLPDAEVRAKTKVEVEGMAAALERGEVVVVGQVLEGPGGKAWENHQVLAYGVERAEGEVRIRVYDPNMPRRDDVVIRVREDGSSVRTGGGKRDREMRGLFRMPYEAVRPGQNSRATEQQSSRVPS